MDVEDFTAAQPLQKAIAAITAAQTQNAKDGAKAVVLITDAKDKVLVAAGTLAEVLGDEYDTICATALSSVNAKLITAKSDAQTEFDLLGT